MKRLLPITLAALLPACAAPTGPTPPLNDLYKEAAQNIGPARNPVVVIPGILGSTLRERDTRQVVWGAFTYGAADADFPEGARLFALPMHEGVPLADLHDTVVPDGVLETLEADVAVARITAIEPYKGIIRTLAAGRYVDRDIARAQARRAARRPDAPVDDAGLHSTCFQFDYDWRRDVSENAARLDRLINDAADLAQHARGSAAPAKVDVVAHSMGGLVLLYYLRYGTQPLPDDASLPQATWAGAARVEHAIIVGTPSAGSVLSLKQLIEGVQYAPIVPEYRPAIVGTCPSVYQLLPRDRHARVVNASTGRPLESLYDIRTWEKYRWGLADPAQDRYLAWLLPDVADPAERRRIALDHLRKCLARAEQLHRALDLPMTGPSAPPPGLTISLWAGDAEPTPAVLAIDPASGRIARIDRAPGDGTVTRASALMDERVAHPYVPRLRSPIAWNSVHFVPADHVGLTTHPTFTDGLLFDLLEDPRATR